MTRLLRGPLALLPLAIAACAPAPNNHRSRPVTPPPAPVAPAKPQVDALRQIADIAIAISTTLESAVVLAAPKVAHKQGAMPTRSELLGVLDDYVRVGRQHMDAIDPNHAPIGPKMEPYARELRALVARWTPGPDVPPDIQIAARTLLDAMGLSAPPGGWDSFEGFRDDADMER